MTAEESEKSIVVRVPKTRELCRIIFISICDNLRRAYSECSELRTFLNQRSKLRRVAPLITKSRNEKVAVESKHAILEIVGELKRPSVFRKQSGSHVTRRPPLSKLPPLPAPKLRSRKATFFQDDEPLSLVFSNLIPPSLDEIEWSFPEFGAELRKPALRELQAYLIDLSLVDPNNNPIRAGAFKHDLERLFKAASEIYTFTDGLELSVWCCSLIDAAVEAIDSLPASKPPAKPTRNYQANFIRAKRLLVSNPVLKNASVTEFRKALGGNCEDAALIYEALVALGEITPPPSSLKKRRL